MGEKVFAAANSKRYNNNFLLARRNLSIWKMNKKMCVNYWKTAIFKIKERKILSNVIVVVVYDDGDEVFV